MRKSVLNQALLIVVAAIGLAMILGGLFEGVTAFAGTLVDIMLYFNEHAFKYIKPIPKLDVASAYFIAFALYLLGGMALIFAVRRMAGLTRRISAVLAFGVSSIYFLLSSTLEGISDEGRWICIGMSFILGTIAVFWPNLKPAE